MTMFAFLVFLFAAVVSGRDYLDNHNAGSLVIFVVCAAVIIFLIQKASQ